MGIKETSFIKIGLLIFMVLIGAMTKIEGDNVRILNEKQGFQDEELQTIIYHTIQFLSNIINILKKALVLSALLFLIENLINFWILTSSYVFLLISMPSFMNATFKKIYTTYNDSFKGYLNIDIQDPKFNISNELFVHLSNAEILQFNWLSFMFEPVIMIVVTIIELSIFKCLLRIIKSKVRQKREEYIKKIIQKRLYKLNNKIDDKQPEKPQQQISIFNIFKSKKIENTNDTVENNTFVKKQKEDFSSIMAKLTYRMMYNSVKNQFAKDKKHWSQAIYINIPQKITSVVINYMNGILIPAYSLLFNNRRHNYIDSFNISIYYLLLGVIFIYPLLSITLGRKYRQRINDKSFFKKSEIESLSQYYLNFFMSISLGITSSIIPFFAITTFILSALFIHSLMQKPNNLSIKAHSCQKLNNIIHKFTFWLFNLVFFLMVGCLQYPQLSKHSQIVIYYCSLSCLIIFIIGGCHQVLEFMIKVIIVLCKIFYMLYQILASNVQQFGDDEKQIISLSILKQQKLKLKLQNKKQECMIDLNKQQNIKKEVNIFDCPSSQCDNQIQNKLNQCNQILHQLIIEQLQ